MRSGRRVHLVSLGLGLGVALAACRSSPPPPAASSVTAKPATSAPPSEDVSAKVDDLLQDQVRRAGPGVAVLVVVDGKVVVKKGYGLADLDSERPITSRTTFDLASLSKQFTAMAILMLEARGALRLDDEVSTFLPELRPASPGRPIRVSDLLHMTSGLGEYTTRLEDLDDPARATNADVLALIGKDALESKTGTKFEYVNTNYVLLALIVERVAKKPHAAFLRDEIFEPLDMRATTVLARAGQTIADRASGYAAAKDGGWRRARLDTITQGDGNVFTSLDDLARWDRALDAAGEKSGLLTKALVLRAMTPGALDDGEMLDYGCGWMLGEHGGRRVAFHTGGWDGTSTYIARYDRAPRMTVAVLSNDEDFDAETLGDAIAERFFE